MLRACIYVGLLCVLFGVVTDTRAQSKDDVCAALDLSTVGCRQISGVSTTLPSGVTLPQEGASATVATNVPWLISPVSTEGENSMRSGDVSDGEGSCLVLRTPLPSNTRVRFSLRTSSEGQFDRLAFFVDDQTVISNFSAPQSSVTKDWTVLEHHLLNAFSNLTWCYLKNGGDTSKGDDSGWLDNLSFIFVCSTLDLSRQECSLIAGTTFDPPEMPWTTEGFLSNVVRFATEGTSFLLSPDIGDGRQSCLVLNVSLPDRTLVQFSRRVNSQPADELYFSVDGVRQEYSLRPAATTVLRDWSREVHILSGSGSKILRWCYVKDASGTAGDDSSRIDNLSFVAPPDAPLNRELVCLVLDLSTDNCALVDSVAADPPTMPWVISSTATEGDFSLRSGDIDDDQTSCLVLGITLPDDRSLRFSLRTDSEAVNDFVYFEADGTRLVDTFTSGVQSESVRDWETLDFLIAGSVSSLTWCYTKNGSTSTGEDSGWLDALTFTVPVSIVPPPFSTTQLCTALDLSADNCSQIQSVSFDPSSFPWQITTDTSVAGGSSLRSGDIGGDQQSCLVLGLSLPANSVISVAARIFSIGIDRLHILGNNLQLDTISAFSATSAPEDLVERDWRQQSYFLPTAISTLSWCYEQDFSDLSEEGAWIDNLSFSAAQSLNIDTETDVTELDLIVALRWLTDQDSSTQTLVANLAITSTGVMTTGIENLRQLFTNADNIDSIDLNGDESADQLDLRILLRYMSGLRGGALAEQGISTDAEVLIRQLLGR